MNPSEQAEKTTWVSIISSVVLAIVKGISGVLGNSYALIADAIESTADVCASFLVLLGFRYAKRPADENHPYGHGKIEPLITFLVVLFLVCSAIYIAHESIQKINTPHPAPEPWTLLVLSLIIIWKELSYRWVLKKSIETHSLSLRADAWHHRSDAITSVMAFVGISLALILGEGYEDADDWAALLASVFIIYNSYLIFRPALGEIMDEHLHDDLMEEIRIISKEVEGIEGTEKCFIRKTGMHYHVDLHALVDGSLSVTEGHRIAHLLQDELKTRIPSINHVLVHIEPFHLTPTPES